MSYLKPRRLLLVLDNREHFLDACAGLADTLLRACPRLSVLATSRESLGIAGETSYRVPSLSLPDAQRLPPLAALAECESVRLFVERARAVQPSFQLTEQDAPAVVQVCWRLDGMPLAIELAAARVRGLAVEGIARRLDDCFRLLTGGSRTALRRQQTLRATIDWSYDLLSPAERLLFRRLAVFAGGWSAEAAEEVCSGKGGEATVEQADVLDLLLRLVDRSLVVAEVASEEERYRFPETIRQYAQEKLLDSGDTPRLRDRHRDWCLRFVDVALDEQGRPTQDVDRLLDQLELEHDNLRAALSWCLETAPDIGLRLAVRSGSHFGSLYSLWFYRGYNSEGRYWLRELLARSPEHTVGRSAPLAKLAWFAADQGDLEEAEPLAEECLAIGRETGDLHATIQGLTTVAAVAMLRGDHRRARVLLEESVTLARQSGEPGRIAGALFWLSQLLASEGDYAGARACLEHGREVAKALIPPGALDWSDWCGTLGELELAEGNLARAIELLEEAVAICRRFGDLSAMGWVLSFLGYAVGRSGDHDRAVALLRESLVVLRNLGQRPRLGRSLQLLGILDEGQGARARATRLVGAAARIMGGSHPDPIPFEGRDLETCLAAARSALGEEAFAAAWAEGQAMTLEQAVEYALAEDEVKD